MQNPNKYIEAPSEVINSLINLFGKRKFNEIILKVNTSIKKYPNSTKLLNIRGSSNLELKKFNIAVKDFKTACFKNPEIPEIYYNLGLSYYHLGNIKYSILRYLWNSSLYTFKVILVNLVKSPVKTQVKTGVFL